MSHLRNPNIRKYSCCTGPLQRSPTARLKTGLLHSRPYYSSPQRPTRAPYPFTPTTLELHVTSPPASMLSHQAPTTTAMVSSKDPPSTQVPSPRLFPLPCVNRSAYTCPLLTLATRQSSAMLKSRKGLAVVASSLPVLLHPFLLPSFLFLHLRSSLISHTSLPAYPKQSDAAAASSRP